VSRSEKKKEVNFGEGGRENQSLLDLGPRIKHTPHRGNFVRGVYEIRKNRLLIPSNRGGVGSCRGICLSRRGSLAQGVKRD